MKGSLWFSLWFGENSTSCHSIHQNLVIWRTQGAQSAIVSPSRCQRWKRELMRSIKLLLAGKMETQMGNGTGVGKPGRELGNLLKGPVLKARTVTGNTQPPTHCHTPSRAPPGNAQGSGQDKKSVNTVSGYWWNTTICMTPGDAKNYEILSMY